MKIGEKLLYMYGYLTTLIILVGLVLAGYTKCMDIYEGAIHNTASILLFSGLTMYTTIFIAWITKELIDELLNKKDSL